MKKLIALFLALTCALGTAGCNQTQEHNNPTSDVPDTTRQQPLTDSVSSDTFAETSFDIAVSYANWGDLSEIYAKALNSDKMMISSVRHLPIYKFGTHSELEQFKSDVDNILSIDQSYDEVPSFNTVIAKYDEAFFNENTLMLVYVEANSGTFRYDVHSVYHDDSNFCIHIEQTNNPEIVTDDMAGWFVTVAVPDRVVENCNVFDADLNNFEN